MGVKMNFLKSLFLGLGLLLCINLVAGQEVTSQSLYLEAGRLIREENFADAKVLLERILADFPADEIAIKADEKLSEILEKAKAQTRDRLFRTGPGVYVLLRNGESHPLQAYKVTMNNLAAESGRPEDGTVRALSSNMTYSSFVLTDIDRLVLFIPTEEMKLFRFERISPDFPYHTLRDNGEIKYTTAEKNVYDLDFGLMTVNAIALAEEEARKAEGGLRLTLNLGGSKSDAAVPSGIIGVSAPPSLDPNALFVSQATGTWGKNPGPVVNVVWPFRFVRNYRAYLQERSGQLPDEECIRIANDMLAKHVNDASIEWYIAEHYANLGNTEQYIAWTRRQFEKAQQQGDTKVQDAASKNLSWGNEMLKLSAMMQNRENHQFTDEEIRTLESCAKEQHGAHIAYYLLSLASEQRGDYEVAEKMTKRAEKELDESLPYMTYCGLLGASPMSRSAAYKSAKSLYKERAKTFKQQRKNK